MIIFHIGHPTDEVWFEGLEVLDFCRNNFGILDYELTKNYSMSIFYIENLENNRWYYNHTKHKGLEIYFKSEEDALMFKFNLPHLIKNVYYSQQEINAAFMGSLGNR